MRSDRATMNPRATKAKKAGTMDFEQIKTFLRVVEIGSFIAAGAKLGVTQSTISARMKELELDLGQTLFVRHKSGVTLTPSGRKFLPHAQSLMRNLRQAREDVTLAADLKSVISFGGPSAQWTRLLAAWVHDFRLAQPDVALRCTVDTPDALLHGVSDGSLDFAVLSNPTQRAGIRFERLAIDQVAFFATTPDHGGVGTPDYILVDWGPEFMAWHAEQFPGFSTPRLQVNQVPLAVRLMHNYGGACYAPVRCCRFRL